jgi:hypothetical protein
MKSRAARVFRGSRVVVCCAVALTGAACSNQGVVGTLPVLVDDSTPSMPMPSVSQAALSGHVRGADGVGVAGATIEVAETDGTATTDEAGAYRIVVPSNSTVTLMATAKGMAPTFRESIVVAAQADVADFDFLALPAAQITAINTLGAPGQEATRGIMAVRLHSLDPACVADGAQVAVWPPMAAKVIYGSPDASGGLARPDPQLVGVQPNADVAVWLAAVWPPGNGLTFTVAQPGCTLMADSPSMSGLTFPGQRHVAPQAMTQVDLFLGGTP